MGQWVCSFSFAHADTVYMPWKEGQKRIVFSMDNNLNGDKVRFRFSNRYGIRNDEIASVIIGKEDSDRNIPVTVGKRKSFVVPAGKSILTDAADLAVTPGETIWCSGQAFL